MRIYVSVSCRPKKYLRVVLVFFFNLGAPPRYETKSGSIQLNALYSRYLAAMRIYMLCS